MTKSELIYRLTETLADKHYLSLEAKDVEPCVKALVDAMSRSLSKGQRIEIRGFGSFVVKEYDTYTGRNPKTGEQITVQPKKLPFFKVGKDLREQVNRDKKE